MTRTLLSWPSRERNVVPSSILHPHHPRHQALRHLAVCSVAATWALARNRRWHHAPRPSVPCHTIAQGRLAASPPEGEARSVT